MGRRANTRRSKWHTQRDIIAHAKDTEVPDPNLFLRSLWLSPHPHSLLSPISMISKLSSLKYQPDNTKHQKSTLLWQSHREDPQNCTKYVDGVYWLLVTGWVPLKVFYLCYQYMQASHPSWGRYYCISVRFILQVRSWCTKRINK